MNGARPLPSGGQQLVAKAFLLAISAVVIVAALVVIPIIIGIFLALAIILLILGWFQSIWNRGRGLFRDDGRRNVRVRRVDGER